MSSSSDSEDENLKQILESVDTSLLTDSLFKAKESAEVKTDKSLPKSQRKLQDDDKTCIDYVPPDTIQKLMSKKLALLVKEQVEFVEVSNADNHKKTRKSKVKLLNEFDCYVKPFEEFEYENLPQQKPVIKRRLVDEVLIEEESKIKSVVLDGEYILSRKETENWSKKKKPQVFSYKLGKGAKGIHHLIETENEFTKLRRKNNWNESKISKTKFSKK